MFAEITVSNLRLASQLPSCPITSFWKLEMKNTPVRILVVDDNPEIHNDFKKILGKPESVDENFSELAELFGDSDVDVDGLDVEIDSAFQGEQAIEMVRQSVRDGKPYSLAFVDVRMPPGLDGVETTQRLWEIDPEIQIVICSAYSDYSWQEIVYQLKHSDQFLILKKPFESIEVRQLANALHLRWQEARRDKLTGLTNRQAFVEHFRRQVRLASDNDQTLSCVMIDIDFFKRVNDLYGHGVGDLAIQRLAEILSEFCRDGDHVCRYGGEEFCVLLREADENRGFQWAEQVRLKLQNTAIATGNEKPIHITASFGVAELDSTTKTAEALIDQAITALRHAKQLGRDQVCRFGSTSLQDSDSLANDLRRPFHSIKTCELMRPANVINGSATLRDAAAILIENSIAAAPVVDEQGLMVGVLTESDLLRVLSGMESGNGAVYQTMRASVVGFSEDTSLQEIFEFVVRVSIPQVVILRDGRPCGVVGRKALLEWLYSNGFGLDATQPDGTDISPPANGVPPIEVQTLGDQSNTLA